MMEILSEQNKLDLSNILWNNWRAAAGERKNISAGDLKKNLSPQSSTIPPGTVLSYTEG